MDRVTTTYAFDSRDRLIDTTFPRGKVILYTKTLVPTAPPRKSTSTSISAESLTNPEGRSYSFYSPELNLIESERTSALRPLPMYEYIWFSGIPVAQVDLPAPAGIVHWTFTDTLGTPLLLTDSLGTSYWQAEYEPYGRVHQLRAGDQHQPLRLPGQEAEQFNNLPNGSTERSYNIARWYRSGWSRYTQSDPLGLEEDELTLFSYANRNPVLFDDRLGLVALGPGQRCKGFDRAMRRLERIKNKCKCVEFFRDQFGASLPDLINSASITVSLIDGTRDGVTDCSKNPNGFEMNRIYCGRLVGGFRGGTTAHIILHELAHVADCKTGRYSGNSTEEGAHAEIACFGRSIDLKSPGQLGPPLFGPWLP